MADPKLKPVATPVAPRRVLLNSGTVPTRRVTLKGADGRTIGPKTPAPAPAAAPAATPTPATEPEVDQAAIEAQKEYERQMEEYNRQMEEYNRQMAEYEAQQKAEAEAQAAAEAAAAQAAAEAAAAQAAAEAEAKAAAEAAAAAQAAAVVAAPKPIAGTKPVAGPKLSVAKTAGAKPAAGPKLSVAKPGAAKPAVGPKLGVAKPAAAKPALAPKPAAVPAPAAAPAAPAPEVTPEGEYVEEVPQMTEEEQQQYYAYMEKLQAENAKKPFHKKPIFFVACGVLLVGAIGAFMAVQSSEDAVAAVQAKRAAAAAVLNRAIEINQKEVFTLEDAKAKKVDVKCSKQDAELLLHIILNYDERDETGQLCWGPDTVGTAMNACVLLGIASELDTGICDMVFKTLADNATKMNAELLDELLDRLTKTDIKGLNKKLNTLAKPLTPKENPDVLTVIWTYKERLATAKDVDKVIEILKTKDLDGQLNNAMRAYLFSLFRKMDDQSEKQAIGQRIFDMVRGNEDKLAEQNFMRILAYSCVPDALEYYKGKMEDKKNWKKYGYFFGSWQDDAIVSYLKELRAQCDPEDPKDKNANQVDSMIMKVLTQDRARSVEDAKELLNLAYDDFNTDTSGMQALIIKLDENPDDEAAQAEYEKLNRIFTQKERVIKNLANCKEYHDWIDAILNDIAAECEKTHNSLRHNKLASQVERIREQIKENELKNAASTAKHKKRMELED